MDLDFITPVVLTRNEAANISQCLTGVSWARKVVVIDSESDDNTSKLMTAFSNARVLARHFDNHTAQWNFGLDQVETEWVLTLDADYVCPPEFEQELLQLTPKHDAYTARFCYCVHGKRLRGTLYPPRVVLFRVKMYRYVPDGHTQTLQLNSSPAGNLHTRILHDDRKPLSRWLQSQANYARLEADKLVKTPPSELGWKDRLRRWPLIAPLLTLMYCLIIKRLVLDGRAGIFYTAQRAYAELLLNLEFMQRRL